ncbi:MAG: DUF4198 domain-containing protein [Candidatus Polarisedimenticolia bacterium]
MKPPPLVVFFALAAVAALTCTSATAHDFWIAPTTFHPEVGVEFPVRLLVGEHLQGDGVRRNPDRIEWFAAVQGERRLEVRGRKGDDPAGRLALDAAGLWVIGYRGRTSFLELEPAKFEAYLKEEGLDRIVALRKQRGESQKRSRELYSRCAKSLVSAGGGPAKSGHDVPLGMPLELIPVEAPGARRAPSTFPVRLLFRGEPLEGALVVALGPNQAHASGRTGADGRVSLQLAGPGFWLIKAVHMTEASDRVQADWESLWASLTFEIRQ